MSCIFRNLIQNRTFSLACNTMSKKALVFLAPGAEEMEFVISADVLRRGGVCNHNKQIQTNIS